MCDLLDFVVQTPLDDVPLPQTSSPAIAALRRLPAVSSRRRPRRRLSPLAARRTVTVAETPAPRTERITQILRPRSSLVSRTRLEIDTHARVERVHRSVNQPTHPSRDERRQSTREMRRATRHARNDEEKYRVPCRDRSGPASRARETRRATTIDAFSRGERFYPSFGYLFSRHFIRLRRVLTTPPFLNISSPRARRNTFSNKIACRTARTRTGRRNRTRYKIYEARSTSTDPRRR